MTGEPYSPPPFQGPRGRGFGRALAAILFLCIVAGGVIASVAFVVHSFHSAAGGPRRTVEFVVRQGESVSAIADDLQKQGLVSSSLLFQLYYRNKWWVGLGTGGFTCPEHDHEHGHHRRRPAGAAAGSADASGRERGAVQVAGFQIHFLPGKRAEEIAQLLQDNGVVSPRTS